MKKDKIIWWTGAINFFNCLLFVISWLAIFGAQFTTRLAMYFYLFAWWGVLLNAIAFVHTLRTRSKEITLVGPVLGLIGNTLYGFTAALALLAIIINLVSVFFIFSQLRKR